MRAVSATVLIALAAQAAAAPLSLYQRAPEPFVLPSDLSPEQVSQIQGQFQNLTKLIPGLQFDRRSLLTTLGEDGLDALKGGALSGVGSLLGGGLFSHLFGGSSSNSSSKRTPEPFVLPSDLSPAQVAQIQSEFAPFQGSNSTVHIEALRRSLLSSLGGDAVDALKGGALSGLGSLVGGGLFEHFFGGSSNSSRRAPEPIVLPSNLSPAQVTQIQSQFQQLSKLLPGASFFRRSFITSLGDDAINALKGGALSGLGSLLGGGLFSDIFGGSSNSSSKRAVLEYVEARINQEAAARAFKRELLTHLLDMRAVNELD